MPRTARKISRSGIYHLILRGINKQSVFGDNEDRRVFLRKLASLSCSEDNIRIFGYCLMSNHIHLLIQDSNLAITMRKLCSSFVYWYNKKYNRCGHLYQDRFKSEAVEDERYYLTVLRYIHQNPVKAQMVDRVSDYKWSSYGEYVFEKKIVDTSFTYSLISKEQFIEFCNKKNRDRCLDYESSKFGDDEAKKLIMDLADISYIDGIQTMDKFQRNILIQRIKNVEGLSLRQISRVTGIGYNIIREI